MYVCVFVYNRNDFCKINEGFGARLIRLVFVFKFFPAIIFYCPPVRPPRHSLAPATMSLTKNELTATNDGNLQTIILSRYSLTEPRHPTAAYSGKRY